MRIRSWSSYLGVLAGAWLIGAPFALGYQGTAALVNDIVLGAAILGLSVWATFTCRTLPSWITVALGVWLIIAPFVVGYDRMGEIVGAKANDVALGVVVGAIALATIRGKRSQMIEDLIERDKDKECDIS
jgi:hypothetical protein